MFWNKTNFLLLLHSQGYSKTCIFCSSCPQAKLRSQKFEYVRLKSMFKLSRHSPRTEYKAACKKRHLTSQLKQHWRGSGNNQSYHFQAKKRLKPAAMNSPKAITLSFWICARKIQSCDSRTPSGGKEMHKEEVKTLWLRAVNNEWIIN